MTSSESSTPHANPPDPSEEGPHRQHFSLFIRRVAAGLALAAAIVVGLLFFWHIAQVLLILFAGLLLAVLLHGLARLLSARSRLGYGWSLTVVSLGLAALIGLAGWLLVPRIATQFSQLTETIPQSIERVQEQMRQLGWGERLIQQIPSASEVVTQRQGIWSRMLGVASRTLEVLANVLLIVVTGVYLAANPGLYKRGIVKLVPMRGRARAREVLQAVREALWHWLAGQFISMTIIGVCAWLGLMVIGVPLALALGFIAGLFEFVPLIGPWAGALPAVLLAFLNSPTQALYVALLFLGIQQVESNIITPLVMKHAVSLPPVLTLFATVVAGVLFGIPGILLATPLVVVMMVLIQKLYVEGVLGDTGSTRKGKR